MSKIYIASPFFDEFSRNWVSIKEEEFAGVKYPFFSPRQDGLDFNKSNDKPLKGKLRSDRIKLIFANNVRHLDECDQIVCNLYPCNGEMDLGTLWELGYFVAKHGVPDFSIIYNQLYAPNSLKGLILDYIKELNNSDIESYDLLVESDRYVVKYSSTEESELYDKFVKKLMKANNVHYAEITDDFPWKTIIKLGYLYAMGYEYMTISFKGYGSNIMIAASSKGHISLPGVVDDTFRENLK